MSGSVDGSWDGSPRSAARLRRGRAAAGIVVMTVAVFALLSTLGWLACGTKHPRAAEGGLSGPAGLAASPGMVAAVALDPATLADATDATRPVTRSAREGVEAPAGVVAPLDPALRRVRVVRGRLLEPVQGATVRWMRSRGSKASSDRLDLPIANHRRFEAFATGVTDENGGAEGDSTDEPRWVEASIEGWWGGVLIETDLPASDPVVVRLWPDRTVLVRVVDDATGAPMADFDVALGYQYSEGSAGEVVDWQTSDADGFLRFEHVTQHMEWFWPHMECFVVRSVVADAHVPFVRIDPDKPHERVELRIPSSVELEVEVLRPDGRPFLGVGFVRVGIPQTVDREDGQRTLVEYEFGAERFVLREGRARIKPLEPGSVVRVLAHSEMGPGSDMHTVTLPATAGIPARVAIQLDATGGQIVARFVDGAGKPVREGVAKVNGTSNTSIDADSDLWRFHGHGLGAPVDAPMQLEFEWTFRSVGMRGTAILAAFDPNGVHDVGTVELAPLPILVAGYVVDGAGHPIEAATVTLHATAGSWVWRTPVQTGADGRFVFSMTREDERVDPSVRAAVHATHAAYRQAGAVRFDRGADNVRIPLEQAGRIAGSVILDPEWLSDFIQLRAVSPTTGAERFGSIQKLGEFVIPSLVPGQYDVTVITSLEDRELRFEGVWVRSGEETRDPRLQEIDLRGKARLLEFHVFDAEGSPIDGPTGWVRWPGVSEWENCLESHFRGRLSMVVVGEQMDVWIEGPQHRGQLLTHVTVGSRVVLEPAPRVGLYWSKGPPRIGALLDVSVRATAPDSEAPPVDLALKVAPEEASVVGVPWTRGERIELEVVLRQKGTSLGAANSRELIAFKHIVRMPPGSVDANFGLEFPAALQAVLDGPPLPADAAPGDAVEERD